MMPYPDGHDLADRLDEARQADVDATCPWDGMRHPIGEDCEADWLDAELAYERRCDT